MRWAVSATDILCHHSHSVLENEVNLNQRLKRMNFSDKYTSIKPDIMANPLEWAIFLSIICHINAYGFRFENATDDAGILFVPMNKAQLTYDEWHLCFYYDLQEYFDGLAKLKSSIEDLRSMCNEPLMASEHAIAGHLCRAVVTQFDEHFITLRVKTDSIISFRVKNTRTKRAPLEYVGGLMSAVFGVMDAKDAERYNMQIDRLHENSQYQNELIRQQTTIVASVIQTQNASLHEMRARLTELQTDINSMKKSWIEGDDDIYLKTHFNMVSHLTTLALMYHLDVADAIIRILSHDSHDRLTSLIPAERLKKHLTDIDQEMPKDRELPINVDRENVFQLLSTSTIKSTISDNRIFLEISFPILLQTQYIMYASIPVPVPMQDRYVIISPRDQHFLTDDKLSVYVPIVEREVHSCLNILNQHRVICSVAAPIQNNVRDICEIQLLKDPGLSELPTDCNVQEVPKRNYVEKLPKSNTYFARVMEPMVFRGICGDRAENTIISSSGFITVESGCTLNNDEFSLIAHTVHRTIDDRTIVPTFNLEDIGAFAMHNNKFSQEHRPIFIEDHAEHFRKLTDSLTEVRRGSEIADSMNQWEEAVKKQQRESHWLMIILILAITAIGVIYLHCRKSWPQIKQNWPFKQKNSDQHERTHSTEPVYADIHAICSMPERTNSENQQMMEDEPAQLTPHRAGITIIA